MTKEIYDLTVAYIKAYALYIDKYNKLLDEATGIRGIEYDKDKVQSSGSNDNSKIIECADFSASVNLAFAPVIRSLKKYPEGKRNILVRRVTEAHCATCEEVYEQFGFLEDVAMEIIGRKLYRIDEGDFNEDTEAG